MDQTVQDGSLTFSCAVGAVTSWISLRWSRMLGPEQRGEIRSHFPTACKHLIDHDHFFVDMK
jgi:hypothetical protein